jgi:hypothetical protein
MNLKDNKLLIIGGIIVTGTTIFILYNRAKKSAEVDFILEKIEEFKTENSGDVNIIENLYKKNLLDTKTNPLPKGVKIFNNKKEDWGKITVQLASDFRKAIERVGTDTDSFYNTLNKIGSVLEWQMVNLAYVKLTTRNLMQDIFEESAFRKGSIGILTTSQGGSILLVDRLANILKTMPQYRFK